MSYHRALMSWLDEYGPSLASAAALIGGFVLIGMLLLNGAGPNESPNDRAGLTPGQEAQNELYADERSVDPRHDLDWHPVDDDPFGLYGDNPRDNPGWYERNSDEFTFNDY